MSNQMTSTGTTRSVPTSPQTNVSYQVAPPRGSVTMAHPQEPTPRNR